MFSSFFRRLRFPNTVMSAVLLGSSLTLSPAQAQTDAPSAGIFGSLADYTPRAVVNYGQPFEEPAPFTGANYTSGLPIVTANLPSTGGIPLAEVPLDAAVSLQSTGPQYRFSYTTTNQHGAVALSTAALFLPPGPTPEGGWPVVAWAHGTVGLDDTCTPSMTPRGERDARYLEHWLSQGYAIVASDYAGLGTPGLMSYLNGQVTAANVVDAVIAAQTLQATQARPLSKKWAVIGHSQGGGAALHVALNASARSAEAGLEYVGAVTTGAPAYIEEVVLSAGPTFPPVPLPAELNAYAGYILAGFREARPDINLNSVLTAEGKRWLAAAETACLTEYSEANEGFNVARAFSQPIATLPGLEEGLRAYMETPVSGYDKPIFLGHGMLDTDVPAPIGVLLNSSMWLHQFIGEAEKRNNRVVVRWYPTKHGDTVPASQPDSTPFLRELFAQSHPPKA